MAASPVCCQRGASRPPASHIHQPQSHPQGRAPRVARCDDTASGLPAADGCRSLATPGGASVPHGAARRGGVVVGNVAAAPTSTGGIRSWRGRLREGGSLPRRVAAPPAAAVTPSWEPPHDTPRRWAAGASVASSDGSPQGTAPLILCRCTRPPRLSGQRGSRPAAAESPPPTAAGPLVRDDGSGGTRHS